MIKLTITQYPAPEMIPSDTLLKAACDGLRQLGLTDHCAAVERALREFATDAVRLHYLQRLSQAASDAATVCEARGDAEAARVADCAHSYLSVCMVRIGEKRRMAS
jgi:hypothetical protein